MKKKYLILIILSLLLFQPTSSILTNNAQHIQNDESIYNRISYDNLIKQDVGVGGEEQIKINFNPNYGFEETTSDGGPENYNYYGAAFQYADTAYTGLTHSGTYACRIQALGTEQFYANPYLYRNLGTSPIAYLQDDIEMSFWYYLVSNPDVGTAGNLYLRVRCSTPSGYRTLYYYFSSPYVPENNTPSYGYYDLRGSSTFGIWHNFQRDITNDFTAIFGAPTPTAYVELVYFYATSPANPLGMAEWVVDEISIENTIAYDWFSINGGFESGNGQYWSTYNRGVASIYQTDDHTEGNYALNMTATTEINGVSGDAGLESYWGSWFTPPIGLYANQPGDITLSFDWKYNEYNTGSNHYAYFYVYGNNATHDFSMYWFLGEDSDTILWGNSTGSSYAYFYLAAPGFGIRDSWQSFNIDLFYYLEECNITNMPIVGSGFQIYAGNIQGATTVFLIDNFNAIADPVGDPSFEEDWYFSSSNSIPSWMQNSDYPYVSLSSDAHLGEHAANLSSYDSYGTVSIYRNTHINIANNLFSDFWWKLEAIDLTSYSFTHAELEIDNGNKIYYIFGSSPGYSATNTSNNYYYFIENHNELGTWNNLVRNIAEDINLAFGNNNWNITLVRFEIYGSGIELNSLLLDDVHFVRDSIGPQLINHMLLNIPTYYQNAIMEMLVVDHLTRVTSTRVYYRTDLSWSYVDATMAGMYFHATIPAQDYGNTVEYYFVMKDMFGMESTDNNGGLYYSYEIVDDINPMITILSISTDADYGLAKIDLLCEDVGSGIDFVEIIDNDSLVASVYEAPYSYEWNSSIIQESGLHIITAVAHDNVGNTAETSFNIYVNVFQPPGPFISFFQKWGTLVGAAVVGAAWLGVVLAKFFRKPKV